MTLPALPLLVEFQATGGVEDKAFVLFTSLYALTIGISSRNQLAFGFCLLVGVLFSAAYGYNLGGSANLAGANTMAKWSLGAIVLVHLLERYNLHVADRVPFLRFATSSSSVPSESMSDAGQTVVNDE